MNKPNEVDPFDLVKFCDALGELKISQKELLRAASLGKVSIFYPFKRAEIFTFELCQLESPFDKETYWVPIMDYGNSQNSISESIDVTAGELIKLSHENLKSLLLFEECPVYDLLGSGLDAGPALERVTQSNYFGGAVKWVSTSDKGQTFNVDALLITSTDLESYKKKTTHVQNSDSVKVTSNTALKVLGLLMCHLAKSPKYASGTSPNKSQIKELLLELAEELGISAYGLSKVDERLLADAMKYLEEQKL